MVDASDGQLSEMITNPGGDENRMVVPKAGRAKAAVDPGKAVEKAAKVGSSISTTIPYSLFLEGKRADRKKGCKGREREEGQGGSRES